VGAGLAGITAAYRLAAQGVRVRLFEARGRVGGRCWTARGFAQGQTAEHGGEFIDTRHVHLRGLAGELGLELDDLWAGYPSHAAWPNWVGGRVWSSADVKDQLGAISSRVVQVA
jgi:monoamine oxidase